MARVPKAQCNPNCDGCQAMILSSEQYERMLNDLQKGTPQDVALASQYANIEVIVVFCEQRQELVVFEIK